MADLPITAVESPNVGRLGPMSAYALRGGQAQFAAEPPNAAPDTTVTRSMRIAGALALVDAAEIRELPANAAEAIYRAMERVRKEEAAGV